MDNQTNNILFYYKHMELLRTFIYSIMAHIYFTFSLFFPVDTAFLLRVLFLAK